MASPSKARGAKHIDFGLIFFSSNETPFDNDKYRLAIESTKFADQHDFSSIWIPERHFTRDGWLYPNPVVLLAALARETRQIKLHAGSVVLPLHNPIRVAEEWAMLDNLSDGRVGIAFASGWHPTDFSLAPENYEARNEVLFRDIETVQKLWHGKKIQVIGGDGKQAEIQTYPTPIQRDLPFWITAAGNPKTFARAGEIGANVLTHMYNQSVPELAEKLAIYRKARAEHGFDPATGQVSVMLHTFIGNDEETIRKQIQGPFTEYLKSASYLANAIAYSRGQKVDFNSLSEQDLNDYLLFVMDRLISTQRVLIGTPDKCRDLIIQLQGAGVNEIACQMDWGVDVDLVMQSLPYLNQLKDTANAELSKQPVLVQNEIVSVTSNYHSNGSNGHHKSSPVSVVEKPVEKVVSKTDNELSLGAIRQRCQESVDLEDFYGNLDRHGIQLAEHFQGIKRLWKRDGESLGQIKLATDLLQDAQAYQIHPTLLDACLLVLTATLPDALLNSATDLYLPTGIRSFEQHRPLNSVVWSQAYLTSNLTTNADVIEGNVRIFNDQGELLAEAQGLQLQHTVLAGTTSAQTSAPTTSFQESADLANWLYELHWESATLKKPDPTVLQGNWLVFADKSGIAQKLLEQLEQQGANSIRVVAGSHYRALTTGQYQINPERVEDTRRLLQEITQQQAVTGIIHLWSLDTTPTAATSVASLEEDQVFSTGHALQLIQTIIEQGGSKSPRLWLVTRGAQAVSEDTTQNAQLEITQSPLWGLGKTAALEHPELWGGLIDLDPEATNRQSAQQLLSALSSYAEEDQIAFRDTRSYVARMIHSQALTPEPLTIHTDGSYLITGGLWGLGLEVAKHFARQGAGHLILLGRSALPERAAWKTLPAGSRQALQATGILELEALGAQVHYVSLDITDSEKLGNWLDTFAQQGHPPIRGVIHAASVWQDAQGESLVRPLAQLTTTGLAAVFRPKVIGTWVLYNLLKQQELDFFVSFSSGASLFGSAAQGNYAAAGEFMDILAHYQRAHGQRAISIDWGAISEIGFGGTAEGLRVHEYWESRGIQRINPRQVLGALDILIPQGLARIGVLKLDWELLAQYYQQIASLPLVRHLVQQKQPTGQATQANSILQTLRETPATQWQSVLEEYLKRQVASILRMPLERLDNDQPLTALGLDSLMAIELKNRLEGELTIRIPIVTFLQGPSIVQFASQVCQQLTEIIIVPQAAETTAASEEIVAVEVIETTLIEKPDLTPVATSLLVDPFAQDAESLLAHLDQLSDQDVDTLLAQMMPDSHAQISQGIDEAVQSLDPQDAALLLEQIDQRSDEQVEALLSQIVQKEDLSR
ncbi:bifunctional LLM class flavin-dependent oxidoreductase/SDR family oxidoreductase [Dictyobacter arantiisoli]|uniref:Uncharacterized protein n=1 Tax=Dictyobacter arantiisoli TaxID=2014874 RepID=A0A5A5TCD4_9CHLR|nr:bifunctional LLM class flavin-dependent oxidoreductase/SDR family oxidoreductase [Dictyobacter arantiisoli]GCF09102.1 hypothetical protein KDI_26660 [Dictyobacter arantiisoli]